MTNKLAIIIPYYKPQFFKTALLSIKAQTDKRFQLYIGNDNSPHDPTAVMNDVFGYDHGAPIIYKKFDDNLGSRQLTAQWARCVELATEPYIWLFSDDDVMPNDAVARFYSFIEKQPEPDLVRFNINIINDDGEKVEKRQDHPLHETSADFLKRRLTGQCISMACEYIFSKTVYQQKEGFVNFPLAWAADDATWTRFGTDKGIYTIPGDPVLWRSGAFNISANKENYLEKERACILYIKFVRDNYTVDTNLQLHWLLSQLGVLNYSGKMKLRFFYDLLYSRMFSFMAVIRFIGYKVANKLFK